MKNRVAVLENELRSCREKTSTIDVVDLERAEEALRAGEERYRSLIESTGDWVWEADQDFVLTYDSPMGRKILGYGPDEVVGRTPFSLMPKEELERIKLIAWPAIARHEPIQRIENHLIKKDGSLATIETSGIPLFDELGRYRGYRGVNHDVTERKLAEEALRESEELFRALAESAKAGIILIRADRFIYVNPETIKDLGYTKDELLAMNCWDVVHPDFREMVRSRGLRLLQGLPVPYNYEIKVLTKGGEALWEEISSTVIDYMGEPTILVTAFNITKRKQAEEDLNTAKQQADLYLDLMGHDINNMHQVALGYLELARDLPAGADQAGFLDKSVEVLQRSTQLIGNVRKLQKIHDGSSQRRDVDVCRILEDIQSEYGAVPGKTIRLNLNGYDHCLVRANELLHDLYVNLVNNAIKHTGDGTEIAIGLDSVEDNGRRYYRVAIEDNGPGVHDDNKKSIFNKRLSNHMRMGSSRGMGIGLYIVKSLVESYGGRVWEEDRVKGDYTKGARFVVLLPAVEE